MMGINHVSPPHQPERTQFSFTKTKIISNIKQIKTKVESIVYKIILIGRGKYYALLNYCFVKYIESNRGFPFPKHSSTILGYEYLFCLSSLFLFKTTFLFSSMSPLILSSSLLVFLYPPIPSFLALPRLHQIRQSR